MEPEQTRLAEHFALENPLGLEEICDAIRSGLGLSEFEYGCENETEWGFVVHDGLEFNVSRPIDRPEPRDAVQSSTQLVPSIGQALADLLGAPIHHHRTWLGVGENLTTPRVFQPR